MDELLNALRRSPSIDALGDALTAVSQRLVGVSGVAVVRPTAPVISPADIYATNAHDSRSRASAHMLEVMPLVERELEPFESIMASRQRSFDVAERYAPDRVRRSDVFNTLWRPLGIERQLVGLLGTARAPLGYICVTRSGSEAPFTRKALATLERVRQVVDAELSVSCQLRSHGLEDALAALSTATPAPWLLFDAGGALLWMSGEARARLSTEAARIGSSIALRHSETLERLQAWVRAEVRTRRPAAPRARPPPRLALAGEQFMMRRFDVRSGRALYLVGFADPASGAGAAAAFGEGPSPEARIAQATQRAARISRRRGLSRRQAEVLLHVAVGKTNKAIASLLGCAENTVEFHVTALFLKLQCRSRGELIARFWTE